MLEQNGLGRRIFRPNLKKLADESVRVSVHIRFWVSDRVLKLADLGLDAGGDDLTAYADEFLRLGRQGLMPKRYVKSLLAICEQGRNLNRIWGYKWPDGGHFVSKRDFLGWYDSQKKVQKRFYEWVDQMIATYDEWVAEVREAYIGRARMVIAIKRGRSVKEAARWINNPEIEVGDEAMAMINHLMAEIPPKGDMRRRYDYDWLVEAVEMPEILGSGLNVTELEKRAKAAADAVASLDVQIEQKTKTLYDDEARQQMLIRLQAERATAAAEQAAAQAKLAAEQAIERELLEHTAATKKEQIEDRLTQAGAQVMHLMWTVAETIRESGRDGGLRLHNMQMAKLGNLVDKLRSFSGLCDAPEIDILAGEVAAMVDSAKEAKNAHDVRAALADLSLVAQDELISLRNISRSPLEVENLPTARIGHAELRKARERFSLPVDAPEPLKKRERKGRVSLPLSGDGDSRSVGERVAAIHSAVEAGAEVRV
jgi:hypothetical protein